MEKRHFQTGSGKHWRVVLCTEQESKRKYQQGNSMKKSSRLAVIEHLGSVVVADVSKDSQGIDVTLLSLNERGSLAKQKQFVHRPKFRSKKESIEAIRGNLVYLKQCALDVPCFLVVSRDKKRKMERRLSLLAFVGNSLVQLKEICTSCVGFAGSIASYDFELLDGPSIVFSDKNGGFVYFCGYGDQDFKVISLMSTGMDESTNEVSVIKSLTMDDNYNLLLFVDFKMKMCKTTKAVRISEDGTVSSFNSENLSTAHLPPKEYWDILSVFNHGEIDCNDYSENVEKFGRKREKCVVFATQMKQFLICNRNDIWCCCSIPFEDCCRIEILKSPNHDTLFVLESNSSECCIVSFKKEKVMAHWTGVNHVLVGDFCHLGHNQILVLFSNVVCKDDEFKFLVSDFFCCQKGLEMTIIDSNQSIEVQKSLQAVTKALMMNTQAVMLEMEEKRADHYKKGQLIKETWINLQRMSLQMCNLDSSHQQTLVPMFVSHNNYLKEFEGEKKYCKDNPFVMLEKNQSIISDRLVVNVKLRNNTKSELTHVNLQILLENQVSQSAVISCLPLSSYRNEIGDIPSTNSIPSTSSGSVVDLTAKTEVPFFHRDLPTKVPLIISWRQGERGTSLHIADTMIDFDMYKTGLLFPKEFSQSCHIMEPVQIEILSSESDLLRFVSRLTKIGKKLKFEVILHAKKECELSPSSIHDKQVYISLSKCKNLAQVEIRTKSTFDATQILLVIKAELSKSCRISLPLEKSKKLLEKFANCLFQELSLLEQTLRFERFERFERLTQHASMSDMEVDESEAANFTDSQRTKEKFRQSFQRKRKRIEILMNDENSFDVAEALVKNYSMALQKTNSAADLILRMAFE